MWPVICVYGSGRSPIAMKSLLLMVDTIRIYVGLGVIECYAGNNESMAMPTNTWNAWTKTVK